ncbi:Hydroperoxy fatty acid reductase gpx1 [Cupriavidus pampae]|uniref:Glutathione peroxidase n=1 Tax=Cupriavidus pampae TaxID=659251 RepID=A0ABM8XF47_9BURK|nr:Hydroperoxy fatty acid reductase gpx1 [Cupriavidus pampae]
MSNDIRNVYQFEANALTGAPVSLSDYRGKVLLIVNTASECGFTPQYTGLQTLHDVYGERGFEVLGFPCNQFGKQEPGDAAQIGAFCESRFQVTFPLFAKIDVNGADAHPLYRWLTAEKPGVLGTQAIKWNFTKFLLRRDGTVFKRYAPTTKPDEIRADIETLLADPGA